MDLSLILIVLLPFLALSRNSRLFSEGFRGRMKRYLVSWRWEAENTQVPFGPPSLETIRIKSLSPRMRIG
jgi:hypothetical protein